MTTSVKRPTATLFVQVLGMVMLSLAIAQAVNVWVIFHLPRPTPNFYTAAEISQAIKQGVGRSPRVQGDGPGLIVRRTNMPAPAPPQRFRFGDLRRQIGTAAEISPNDILIQIFDQPDRQTFRQIRERLEREGQSRELPIVIAPFEVAVHQADGSWLSVTEDQSRFPTEWQVRIILWLLITALVIAPIAWLFARRLSSSVALFAEAAERLGREPNAPPIQVKGPSEIRPAIAAFNEMQERLRSYVVDRTAMAAAIAHDLRTPLTRLRFRIESAAPELQAKMAADIDEMEDMISASLAYVRDSRGAAKHEPLELSSLLESIIDDMAETGRDVAVERADRVVLRGDPMGLRRLLTNLVENACKFGQSARCRVFREDGFAVVQIDDRGPGIDAGELEKVFEPFYRGEKSRSRQTGGNGLGLAAVRSIARAHGGEVYLSNRDDGGLRAELRLPV